MSSHGIIQRLRLATRELQAKQAEEAKRPHFEALQRARDYRPLGSRFQDTCRQTRSCGGLPETEEGEEGGIPPGITHDLVLKFDLPARKAEREERLLAFHGGDLNRTLYDICVEGGGKDARFLLAHGADTNHVGEEGWPLLRRAACNGHLSVVEALLDAGAGRLGDALYAGAKRGHTAIVALLLDRGADVHHENDTPLYSAAREGHLETATLLLNRGADPNADPFLYMSALQSARRFGHRAIAALLLARGAIDVDAA